MLLSSFSSFIFIVNSANESICFYGYRFDTFKNQTKGL